MKRILSVLLACAILLTPALTSSASAHNYDHVYTDVNILTPDSFEELFSDIEVDRAAYSYDMIDINSSQAVVAMDIELKVGHDYYTTLVSGTVNAHTLPSGGKLYEGPLDGNMEIENNQYIVTIGFTKVDTTDNIMISATIQGGTTIITISFGDNVMQGEVLDWFVQKTENVHQTDFSGANVIGNMISDDFGNNPGDTASPNIIGDGFAPIFNPGGGGVGGDDGTDLLPYPNLGSNGEWKFQRVYYEKHIDESYNAIETRVYYDITSGNLVIMIHPYISETQEYANSHYGPASLAMLYSIKIELQMLQSTGTSYAKIDGYSIPNRSAYTTSILGFESVYLAAFVKEYCKNYLSVSNNVLTALSTAVHGKITTDIDDMLYTSIDIDLSFLSAATSNVLEEVYPGIPFLFGLQKGNPDSYTGGTEYRVITKIRYCVLLGPYDGVNPNVVPIYLFKELSFDAEIDLP